VRERKGNLAADFSKKIFKVARRSWRKRVSEELGGVKEYSTTR
jgi:hypothetical protein